MLIGLNSWEQMQEGSNGRGPIYIGGNPTNSSEGFTGYMDEVRLWSKALTASEIASGNSKEERRRSN